MAISNVLSQKRERTLRMVQTALLAAIEVILTLLYIPVGTINLNFGLVPIVIAGVFLSPLSGALIGAVSGVVTMTQVLSGQGVFYAFLMSANPFMACLLCIVKTAAAGYVSGLAFRLLQKLCRFETVGTVAAAVLCPVLNTGIFALGMFAVFGNALMADSVISTWTTGGLVSLVFVVLIGANFFIELALNVIVCPVLAKALRATPFFGKQNSAKLHKD